MCAPESELAELGECTHTKSHPRLGHKEPQLDLHSGSSASSASCVSDAGDPEGGVWKPGDGDEVENPDSMEDACGS